MFLSVSNILATQQKLDYIAKHTVVCLPTGVVGKTEQLLIGYVVPSDFACFNQSACHVLSVSKVSGNPTKIGLYRKHPVVCLPTGVVGKRSNLGVVGKRSNLGVVGKRSNFGLAT